jgi:cytochrome c-type biogenesis protein CcmH/NrfG
MPELPFDSPEHPLAGETVVFTGKLWSLGRKESRQVVEQHGGVAEDEVTLRTSMLVVGGASFPEGVPDLATLANDQSTLRQKLRRAAQINAESPGRIRLFSEDDFRRHLGLPTIADLREQHYGQRDILTMYPTLREDHLRYLQKWGFIRPAFRTGADTLFGFGDLTVLRQIHTEMQQGVSFRGVLRDLQAARAGQLAFDFRIDAQPARIIALKPREPVARPASGPLTDVLAAGPLSAAEQYFLMGSMLDDGSPEQRAEAADAYRRALADDPDLVAAIINLANISYARDELVEARRLYEKAIALDPTYFEAHFNLGNIHHDHGSYGDAQASYRTALTLNPDYADAHFYLAVTLEKIGRSGEARTHWRAYQRLSPNGEWVELAREFAD